MKICYYFNSETLPPNDKLKQAHSIKLISGSIKVKFPNQEFKLYSGDVLRVPENMEYKFIRPSSKKMGKLEIFSDFDQEINDILNDILTMVVIETDSEYEIVDPRINL